MSYKISIKLNKGDEYTDIGLAEDIVSIGPEPVRALRINRLMLHGPSVLKVAKQVEAHGMALFNQVVEVFSEMPMVWMRTEHTATGAVVEEMRVALDAWQFGTAAGKNLILDQLEVSIVDINYNHPPMFSGFMQLANEIRQQPSSTTVSSNVDPSKVTAWASSHPVLNPDISKRPAFSCCDCGECADADADEEDIPDRTVVQILDGIQAELHVIGSELVKLVEHLRTRNANPPAK